MDSSSEEAALDLVRIGPTSMIGRVLAIRVLFCKEMNELALVWMAAVARHWRTMRKLIGQMLRTLLWVVNPRHPSVILTAIVGAMVLVRRAKMRTVKAEQNYRRKFWSNLMTSAPTYDEWVHAASMLDKAIDRKRDKELFDEDLVQAKLNDLRLRRLEGGVEDILFFLRADLVRNLGNMCNPELHKGRLQTPRVIQEYINEVRYQLRAVCETDSEEFSVDEKIAFIQETRHSFGRTALLLSGGAALGAFHLGVVRTLIEHRLLPRVVAGASVGSITCSFTATRTWSELQTFFDDPMPPMHFFESMGSIIATAHRLLTKGAVHEIGALQRKMRQLIGDLTFQEAYDLSGRVLGISVCSPRKHEPPRCLNYLTSPHVVIWSAVTASCAFPGLFEAQELMAKDRHGRLVPYHSPIIGNVGPEELNNMKRQWRDGSLESDLPMLQLKELFNVNHFIVSQANPHIAPLLRLKELTRVYGGDFAARLAHIAEMEVKHRCSQALEMGFRLGGLAKLIAQDWEGDVTIVMPATFAQFAKLIQNPSPSELRKAVMQGRRCTWAKLSAIQANCGIELMLDECVSELHRRRKAQKEAEQLREGKRMPRQNTTKRIPSWNCLAHVGSWGSLDDEGLSDQMQAGGPWGGPSVHKLKPANLDGSDSDSGTENFESSNLSWTRVGGPLMKSASAQKFVSGNETDGDFAEYTHMATAPYDSGDGGDVGSGYASTPTRSGQDQRSSKRGNKIWSRGGCSPRSEDNDYTEAQDFSYSVQVGLKKSANAISRHSRNNSFAEGELFESERISTAFCECLQQDKCTASRPGYEFGSVDKTEADGHRLLNVESLEVDSLGRTGTQNPEDLGALNLTGRGASRGTSQSPRDRAEAEDHSLEMGAFGSSTRLQDSS
ncbi:unnamed protein product [Calypogeia fissa]